MKFGREWNKMTRRTLAAISLCALAGFLGGCGGGGGGSNGGGGGTVGNAIVMGTVLLTSTNAPPATAATITSGGISTTANAADGTFTLSNVPTSATTLTLTVAQTSGSPLVRTLPIALTANTTANLGTVYVGGTSYDATITGRVVTQGTAGTQGVGGATVTIAGVQVKTSASPATLGQFTISGLPAGLGSDLGVLLGNVQATGFATYQLVTNTSNLNFPNGLVSGANTIGDITILQPSGSTPAPPATISGTVTVNATAVSGQFVQILLNGTQVGSTTTDINGGYAFWVVPGTYTIKATSSNGQFNPQAESVTLNALNLPITAPTLNLGP